MNKLAYFLLLLSFSATAHKFSAEECNAGAGVVSDIVRVRDEGLPKSVAYTMLDELQFNAKGTKHEIDSEDLSLFRGYADIIYLHEHLSRDDAWLQFYKTCKLKLDVRH